MSRWPIIFAGGSRRFGRVQDPADFGNKLFEFQIAAVKIAAHHLNKRGGVLIGDVVGLGKTLMATALARIFEDDHGLETLIICPKNLVTMWEDYRDQYRLRAEYCPSAAPSEICQICAAIRWSLIDESHNLRNREGKIYRAIQEYIFRTRASASCFPPRRTTKPTSTFEPVAAVRSR